MTEQFPRILVVEDEFLVAVDVGETLTTQMWEVIGPVPDVVRALELVAGRRPDAVCMDMNLKGGDSVDLAMHLTDENIPFVVLTGDRRRLVLHPAFEGVPIMEKPYTPDALVATIAHLLRDHSRGGRAPQATACTGNRPVATP